MIGKGKKEADKGVTVVKLQIAAGTATPAPPIGSSLGPKGINLVKFCKEFNDATKDLDKGSPVPVEIAINPDKTFTFRIKNSPTSYLLLKHSGVQKGSSEPGRKFLGKISKKHIEAVARIKMDDIGSSTLEAAMKSVEGTAISMGFIIDNESE